jgi:hypothetical protein
MSCTAEDREAKQVLDTAPYDNIAPAVPHALHMPSHIYSILGV